MTGGGAKKKDRERENYYHQANRDFIEHMKQPTAIETYYNNRLTNLQNWENSDGRDIRDMPGMGDYIQIGEAAMARADRERMGQGALNLTGEGGHGHAAKLKSLRQKEMGREVGAGLERARGALRAEVLGGGSQAGQMYLNRNSAGMGHTGSMYGMQLNYKPMSWWDRVMQAGQFVSNLGQGAGAAMSGWGRRNG